jgi:ElaB/YqjD/DUF883 family membrane-anchored ribosome-binding protein
MGQTADQLRQEIDGKRDDAAAKIDEIEARVQSTAQVAKKTVEETMQTAKDTVTETVTESVEAVKQSFDLQRQVDERPLLMLGAAALGGFILAGALGGEKHHRSERYSEYRPQSGPVQRAVHSSGLDSTMAAVTGAVVGMATDHLRSLVDESFPEFGRRLRQEMNTNSTGAANPPTSSPGASATTPDYGYPDPRR